MQMLSRIRRRSIRSSVLRKSKDRRLLRLERRRRLKSNSVIKYVIMLQL